MEKKGDDVLKMTEKARNGEGGWDIRVFRDSSLRIENVSRNYFEEDEEISVTGWEEEKPKQLTHPHHPPPQAEGVKKSSGIDGLTRLNVKLKFKWVGSASSAAVCSIADNHVKLQSKVPLDGSVSGEAGKMLYGNFRD